MFENPYVFIAVVSLVLGLFCGYIMHRADYCVTATFRDFFIFKDNFMLRVLLLHVVVTAVLFELARLFGWISPFPFPLLGPMSLANVLGGVVFGIGMVLAGGCVIGVLYKLGAGSIVSLVAFIGLLIGATLYAEIFPYWQVVMKSTTLFKDDITLAQAFGINQTLLVALFAVIAGVYLFRSNKKHPLVRITYAEGYIQPWKAAIGFSIIGLVSYVLIGMPLGITTSYSKIGASVEQWFLPEHVAGLAYFQAQPLNYIPPFFDTAVTGGAGPALDGVASIQYPLVIGIILGALISALLLKEFHLLYKVPIKHYISALLGGVILGLGARMTPACNVWHLWGGVPIFAGQSVLFLVGLLPGTWIGSILITRYVVEKTK